MNPNDPTYANVHKPKSRHPSQRQSGNPTVRSQADLSSLRLSRLCGKPLWVENHIQNQLTSGHQKIMKHLAAAIVLFAAAFITTVSAQTGAPVKAAGSYTLN